MKEKNSNISINLINSIKPVNTIKKIIHIDMDAFYASVEQRDFPKLRGKPVIVGGPPDSRGVVATCSYEARKFGVHSAMASSKAYRLCPEGIFVPPRFQVYKEVSIQINAIFREYTDLVEPMSLDEAYLDVTGCLSATLIAREIKKKINETTNLTASAGVSYNKFLAKIASDYNKPDGLTLITPDIAIGFIEKLPIGKFFGIGKVTERKMLKLGVKTGADLKLRDKKELSIIFGKAGSFYYDIVRGIDRRAVTPYRKRKSIGKERTFQYDINDHKKMRAFLKDISIQIERYLHKKKIKGYTVTLKVKYADFKRITRSRTLSEPIFKADVIFKTASGLLKSTDAGKRSVRLLGITISHLADENDLGNKTDAEKQPALPFGD